jgi:phytoene dehydrogenase-like protein
MHWLLGSGSASPFYKLWSELLDMNNIRFVNHDLRVDIGTRDHADKYGNKVFHLYTNVKRLEAYMLDIAPEDKRAIKKFISSIRTIQKYEVPPAITTALQIQPWYKKIGMIKFLPMLFFLMRWNKITNFSFAEELQNPFLKESFRLLFDAENTHLLVMTMPLAFYDRNGAGYPLGGSFAFAKKIEEKYLALGGKIHYGKAVNKIITKDGKAQGLQLTDGTQTTSDIVISAADWHFTLFNALEGKFVNKKILQLDNLEKYKIYYSVLLVSLGIDRPINDLPHFFRFPLEKNLVSPDGTIYERLEAHIYNYDPTLAPEGKTVVAASFYTTNAAYWINLRETDREKYKEVKEAFAREVTALLDKKIGGISAHLEECDVATPATYHRYTGNRLGSVQGWLPGKNIVEMSQVEMELPGLKNFYYAGHWTQVGGGLPVAIKSARDVAQVICHRNKIKFRTQL